MFRFWHLWTQWELFVWMHMVTWLQPVLAEEWLWNIRAGWDRSVCSDLSLFTFKGKYGPPTWSCHSSDYEVYCLLDVTLWEKNSQLVLWTYFQSLVLHIFQAATYGCGCWATNGTDLRVPAMAACTSGCGEYLVRTLLAREAAVEVQKSECPVTALHNAMKTKFLGEASKCEILISNIHSMISK